MIIVLKLTTGEEVIGECSQAPIALSGKWAATWIDLEEPMWIAETVTGAMKLKHATMLAKTNVLSFKAECVITIYEPSSSFVKYYNKAVEFNNDHAIRYIDAQIENSIQFLNELAKEETQQLAAARDQKLH